MCVFFLPFSFVKLSNLFVSFKRITRRKSFFRVRRYISKVSSHNEPDSRILSGEPTDSDLLDNEYGWVVKKRMETFCRRIKRKLIGRGHSCSMRPTP